MFALLFSHWIGDLWIDASPLLWRKGGYVERWTPQCSETEDILEESEQMREETQWLALKDGHSEYTISSESHNWVDGKANIPIKDFEAPTS